MLPPFELARPATVEEAVALLDEDCVPYCGGTELLLAMGIGLLRPETLVDLKRVPELREIRREDGRLVIGATTSHLTVSTDERVRAAAPMLAQVEEAVGNARVRAQGSLGGNLCFGEPKSDVATALIAYGATLTLVSPSGRREVSTADFFEGPYWTVREPEELLVAINVPVDDSRRGVYLKFQTMERPTVGVALMTGPGGDGCRLVVGAVGDLPLVVDAAHPGEIDADDVAAQIEPVSDLTGSVRYKRHVTAVYVRRAVAALEEQR